MHTKFNLSLAVIVLSFAVFLSALAYGKDCQLLTPHMYHKASNHNEAAWVMPNFDDTNWSETTSYPRYYPPKAKTRTWEPGHSYQYYRIWIGSEEETKSVKMHLNAGHDVHVYINGHYFGSNWYMGTNLTDGEIIHRLNKGLNLIALQVQIYEDTKDPFGLLDFSLRICDQPILEVPIDIKPGSCLNPLATDSEGGLTVAVAGSEGFDVKEINSVRLNGVPPLSSFIENVSTPDHCYDFEPDENDDLVFNFETQKIIETLGKVSTGKVVPLTLTGTLNNGTKIEGKGIVTLIR